MATTTREASLRAVAAYERHINDIPRFWKSKPNDMIRNWAIDDDGQVVRIPTLRLVDFGARLEKDGIMISASMYCARYKPAAIITAAEAYVADEISKGTGITKETALRLHREMGDFSMSDESTRLTLLNKYGVRVNDVVVVSGEIHGHAPYAAMWRMSNGRVTNRFIDSGARSRWSGILDGNISLTDISVSDLVEE